MSSDIIATFTGYRTKHMYTGCSCIWGGFLPQSSSTGLLYLLLTHLYHTTNTLFSLDRYIMVLQIVVASLNWPRSLIKYKHILTSLCAQIPLMLCKFNGLSFQIFVQHICKMLPDLKSSIRSKLVIASKEHACYGHMPRKVCNCNQ